jgi:hypothetical protein
MANATSHNNLDGVGEDMNSVLEETGLARLYAAIQQGTVYALAQAPAHAPHTPHVQHTPRVPQTYECDEKHTILLVPARTEYTIINKVAKDIIFIVDESAIVHYHTSIESRGSAKSFIYLLKDAKLDWVDASSADGVQNEHVVYFSQEGADAKYRSMFLLAGQERHAASVFMVHAAPNTKSTMLTRAVLLDASRASYQGTIKILPQAHGCSAKQHEDTLLLGASAHIDAVPILEIENDDVKCSHGVTVGSINEEQLFYLQARGVSIEEAKRTLIMGFFDRMLISADAIGKDIREEYLKKLTAASIQQNT